MKLKLILLLFSLAAGSALFAQPEISLVPKPADRKIDVLVDGKLFTSYIYPEILKKPVLWPVISAGGNEITRCFPMKEKGGERADHPHHVGIWLNYGDVNGLDFWNNSEAIPADKAAGYGTIYHETLESVKSGKGQATLITTAKWKDIKGNTLLNEYTDFVFSAKNNIRIIDRTTMLKAENGKVAITDNKEGMFAIRVTRELELPENKPVELTDSRGNVTKVEASADAKVTGSYLSSEGFTDAGVWGTRGKWMKLSGVINGEKVSIIIFDHPQNVGYPTYWHARGYGLFAANPLGQKIFTNGKQEMNFSLEKGESVTFRYRIAIVSGEVQAKDIETLMKDFESKL